MPTINDIYTAINAAAPFSLACEWDNVGIIIDTARPINSVLTCLDVNDNVVSEAISANADLIISHHPVMFSAVKQLKCDDIAYKLVQNNIGLIAAHTNLDAANGGINDALCAALTLTNVSSLFEDGLPVARIGTLAAPLSAAKLANLVKDTLQAQSISFNNLSKKIERVAICSGAGEFALEMAVLAGAEALITSELPQHRWIYAVDNNFCLIDAGHFYSERIAASLLQKIIVDGFSDITCTPAKETCPYIVI